MAKEVPERRTNLIAASFSLRLSQGGNGKKDGGSLTLEVTDTHGSPHVLQSKPVKDDGELIGVLLWRISREDGEAGWKFDSDFYPSKNKGIIVG
jgi:hypothetical protein